jgi:MFS family permease
MSSDARRILVAQALRGLIYGFASVLLGVSLQERGWSSARVGLLLTGVVAGTALMSIVVGTVGDRVGRRRMYVALFLGLAASGLVFGLTAAFPVLFVVALSGTLSTEVVESGPFTSLEQAMLPQGLDHRARIRVFGVYNAVATVAGSLGALAAGGPTLLRSAGLRVPADQRFFLALVPIGVAGALVAASLSGEVGARSDPAGSRAPLTRSRSTVLRLSGLFGLDAFGGGLVVQAFIAYWLRLKFGASTEVLGLLFFAVGFLQAGSFLAATRLAARIGLLETMVFTHLPSNLLLAAVPLAPNLPIALGLLLGRFALSQMDVPTRQAYVVALVDPEERTAAAAYTNTARYLARPLAPTIAGAVQQVALGLPFFLGGGIKTLYDLAVWSWLRRVPLPGEAALGPEAVNTNLDALSAVTDHAEEEQ